jgi:hypothetical protein
MSELVDRAQRSGSIDLEPSRRDQVRDGLRPLRRPQEVLRHRGVVGKRVNNHDLRASRVEVRGEQRRPGFDSAMAPTASRYAASNAARRPAAIRFRLMKTIGPGIDSPPANDHDPYNNGPNVSRASRRLGLGGTANAPSWSSADIANVDENYLLWLSRMPVGRSLQREIDELVAISGGCRGGKQPDADPEEATPVSRVSVRAA